MVNARGSGLVVRNELICIPTYERVFVFQNLEIQGVVNESYTFL